jgi:hypothetical protein
MILSLFVNKGDFALAGAQMVSASSDPSGRIGPLEVDLPASPPIDSHNLSDCKVIVRMDPSNQAGWTFDCTVRLQFSDGTDQVRTYGDNTLDHDWRIASLPLS